MAVTKHSSEVADALKSWFEVIGINSEHIRGANVSFDLNDVVVINIKRIMVTDDIKPFQEMLKKLTPKKALVEERYEIRPIPLSNDDLIARLEALKEEPVEEASNA